MYQLHFLQLFFRQCKCLQSLYSSLNNYSVVVGGTAQNQPAVGLEFKRSLVSCGWHYIRASISISTKVQGSGMPNFLSTCM
uniref:Uncharacterized protein n=1 Tax=Arundo donax TaxID=35708 RepID=A0A0A9DMX4_ARUDO